MARSTACSGVGEMGCPTVLWQSMQSIVRRSAARIVSGFASFVDVLLDLAFRVGHSHVRDRLPLRIRRHVLDANGRIRVPVNRTRRRLRDAHVHLQHRHRLGVGFVVGILADDADAIADDASGLVAALARLRLGAGRHLGAGRNRLRIVVGGDHHQLADAAQLRVHESRRALADVTLRHTATPECAAPCQAWNCGCIGVWHACPQKPGDSIACRPPYPASSTMTTLTAVSAAMRSAVRRTSRATKIDDGPFGHRRRIAKQLASLEPHARRDEQQPHHEHGGDRR